jgi:phosphatidate cytidylyltransferase
MSTKDSTAYKRDPAFIARLLTAALLAPLAIWGVLSLPSNAFAGALAGVLLLGTWEWSRIIGVKRRRFRGAVVLLNAGLMAACWLLLSHDRYVYVAELGVLWWCVALLWLKRVTFGQGETLQNVELKMLVGSLLMLPAWCSAVLLHESANGPRWTLFVFAVIWCADCGAYFAGRRFGSKKLAPQISPGKTREGVYGGLAAAGLFASGIGLWIGKPLPEALLLTGLSLITVLFSIVGDLFESLMKRHANLKDSGNLLPGHGGVLDRIDSLLAALPAFVAGKVLLGI